MRRKRGDGGEKGTEGGETAGKKKPPRPAVSMTGKVGGRTPVQPEKKSNRIIVTNTVTSADITAAIQNSAIFHLNSSKIQSEATVNDSDKSQKNVLKVIRSHLPRRKCR